MNFLDKLSINLKLRLIQGSNGIALLLSIFAIIVCFSQGVWAYGGFLFVTILYLCYATYQFIEISNDKCMSEMKTISYDRQVTTLQTRLSAVSNAMAIVVSLLYIIIEISRHLGVGFAIPESFDNEYITGLVRLIVFYIVIDKVHNSRILINTYQQMSNNLRHLSILHVDPTSKEIWPIMYVDGFRLSSKRYCAAICDDELVVVFTPSLSLSADTLVEYELVEPAHRDNMFDEFLCSEVDLDPNDGKPFHVSIKPKGTSCTPEI